ncbi:MAG: putative deacylase [Myxococcota bacterium]
MSTRVLATTPVHGVPDTTLYEAVTSDDESVEGPIVAIVGMIHGNEIVGRGVLRRLAETVGLCLHTGSILAVRANVEAARMNVRHTSDGRDMNRLWDRATLDRIESADRATLCSEERRVLELAPLLLDCDVVLDLHSTSRPSQPHIVFRDDQRHAALARLLGVEHLVTGLHENAILDGGICANVGIDLGQQGRRLGFTLEAGQHLDDANLERAWGVVVRLLAALGMWSEAAPPVDVGHVEIYEVTDRFRQAPAGTERYRFVGYEGGEPVPGQRISRLRRLHSFERIEADEVVLRRGRDVQVRAQASFTMLMPAPDTDPGTDLYYVTQPRHGGLSAGVFRTDSEARGEALAIERMLDLMADDDFASGCTWVGLESRRLMDLVASVVARNMRLPPGDPHRRIKVIGRGELPGDDTERRAGQRYRQAMRRAIVEGLPVERFQICRGASLGWVDQLTRPSMAGLLARRERAFGASAPPVSLRVSLRQPHTLSLLVAGDLEHARNTGDMRHVRVALLVEAATLEPDGDSANVRVVRAGVLSARPELLEAAEGLLTSLRDEHRLLARHGPLRGVLEAHRSADGAFEATPAALEEMNVALAHLQLRQWCGALEHLTLEPRHLAGGTAGGWLAEVVGASGVFDVDALRHLLLVPESGGHRVVPERVAELRHAVDKGGDWRALVRPQAPPVSRAFPRQPIEANSITGDDLERWVGWKRFVRQVQAIPDTRGKDLDLAFTARDIRLRLARWFREARRAGRKRPGDVLVVVAGDGLSPARDAKRDASRELVRAHKELLLDPTVCYHRIQHAQTTHLSWMKDMLSTLRGRPEGGSGVEMHWETEHGGSVNVVLLATRHAGPTEGRTLLDGWSVDRCAVLVSDLQRRGHREHRVALFTEPGAGRRNAELLHFGRAHCEGLVTQASQTRARHVDQFERGVQEQLAGWIRRVRSWDGRLAPVDSRARTRWVARRLGIADTWLAHALSVEMHSTSPADRAAQALWESVPEWPSVGWSESVG